VLLGKRSLKQNWSTFFRVYSFLSLNAMRQYMLGTILAGVTSIVLNGEIATNLILNGLALYSILEIDNLVFFLITSAKDMGELAEFGKVHHPYSEAWLNRIRSSTMGIAYLLAIIIPSFLDKTSEITVEFYFDPNGWFGFLEHGRSVVLGDEIAADHENILNAVLVVAGIGLPIAYVVAQAGYYIFYREKWHWGKQFVRLIFRLIWIGVSMLIIYYIVQGVMSYINGLADDTLDTVATYMDKVLDADQTACAWAYLYDATVGNYETYAFCDNDISENSTYAYCIKVGATASATCSMYPMVNASSLMD